MSHRDSRSENLEAPMARLLLLLITSLLLYQMPQPLPSDDMRYIQIRLQSIASFLMVTLATVYLANLTVTVTNHHHFQLETNGEWDHLLASGRQAISQPLNVEIGERDESKHLLLHDDAHRSIRGKEQPLKEDESSDKASSASGTTDTRKLMRQTPMNEVYNPRDDEEHSEDSEEKDPDDNKANVTNPLPQSEEWWRRKRRGIQRRHSKTLAYIASHNNISLPSSMKERSPAFLLIGAQKSGTMALRTYLAQHPLIEVPSDVGETHYFDKHFVKQNATTPEEHLETYVTKYYDRDCRKNESFCISGESTPIYLYDTEHVPARVKQVCPWTKFIVILRDPVKRAVSHCNMLIERNEIKDTFEMRLERDFKWMVASGLINNATLSHKEELEAWRRYQNTSRVATRWKKLPIGRGFYELQLRKWFQYFPRKQFLILKSEELDSNRETTMARVFEFLGIPNHVAIKHKKKIHQRSYSFTPKDDVYDFLYDFYRPYNQRLTQLLGPEWKDAWENPRRANSVSDEKFVVK